MIKNILLFILCIITFNAFAQPGHVDPTWNPNDLGNNQGENRHSPTDSRIYNMKILNDGKILIVGDFQNYEGYPKMGIARLNVDGTLDTSYIAAPNIGNIKSLLLQNDQKAIISGIFTSINGITAKKMARLNIDGTLDTTFTSVFDSSGVNILEIQLGNDGKIMVSGGLTGTFGNSRLLRLNNDGSVDTTFDSGTGPNYTVSSMIIQSDGKILLGGYFTFYNGIPTNKLIRLNVDGSIDSSFNPPVFSGATADMAIQPDNKIIAVGEFFGFSNYVTRLFPNGDIDSSFHVPNTGPYLYSINILNNSKIIVSGWVSKGILRLNNDGSIDSLFNVGTGTSVDGFPLVSEIQDDGKIILAGGFGSFNGWYTPNIARILPNGTYDTSFQNFQGASDVIQTGLILPDGRILIGGKFTGYNGKHTSLIALLNSDGVVDSVFNSHQNNSFDLRKMCLQSNGKIVIGGNIYWWHNGTARYLSRIDMNANYDSNFPYQGTGPNTNSFNFFVQPDDKILFSGVTMYNGVNVSQIFRLNSNGSKDLSFYSYTNNAYAYATSAVFQSDGKIIIGGHFSTYNGLNRNRIVRSFSDGNIDTSFQVGTGFNNSVKNLALQPDGKIIVIGDFTSYNGINVNGICRLNNNGSLDTTFNVGIGPNFGPNVIALEQTGKILIAGNFTSFNGLPYNRIARLNVDGSLDTSFDIGDGFDNTVSTILIQNDGKIIIAGAFRKYNNIGRNRIVRLLNDPCSSAHITNTISSSRCNAGSVTLQAFADAGTINWYANGIGGASIGTGNTFVSPVINNTTTYYVSVTGSNCTSERFPVIATIHHNSNVTQAPSICTGDSYIVNGNAYSSTGTYIDTLTTVFGCDSIITTNLSVLSTLYANQNVTLCDGQNINVGLHTYNTVGNYYDTLQTSAGCDSIVLTQLNVNPTFLSANQQTTCAGIPYAFNGHTYSLSGNYYDTLSTISGCDSIINTQLVVYPSYNINNPQTICYGESYDINSHNYYVTGIYYDTLQTQTGCDSIITTDLIVNAPITYNNQQSICYGETYTINGHSYNTTGVYYDTLQTQAYCDSIVITNLMVNNLNLNILQVGNALLVSDSLANYQWIDCNNLYLPISGQTNQLYYPINNGNYAVILNNNNCVDTTTCFQFNMVAFIAQEEANFITIYPNPFTIETSISFNHTQRNSRIEIIDLVGKTVKKYNFTGKQLLIQKEDLSNGVYLLQIIDSNERKLIKKIIVQ